MKTIIIETVSNGWIVREHLPCPNVYQAPIAVFNRMIDLQTALPELLEAKDHHLTGEFKTGAKLQDMLDHIRGSAGAGLGQQQGGDRRPETIGGNELCPSA